MEPAGTSGKEEKLSEGPWITHTWPPTQRIVSTTLVVSTVHFLHTLLLLNFFFFSVHYFIQHIFPFYLSFSCPCGLYLLSFSGSWVWAILQREERILPVSVIIFYSFSKLSIERLVYHQGYGTYFTVMDLWCSLIC